MKIPSTNPYPLPVTTTVKTDNQPKDDFSGLLQQRILDHKTSSTFTFQVGVTSDGKPVLGGAEDIPGYLEGEERELRNRRLDMLSIWGDIQSAETSRMHSIESQFGNKMAKDLGLSAPFRLSTSWNEYMNGQPLMVANADFPTVHPQSDQIREYLDAHLKEVPELSGLINSHTKYMAQYRSLGSEAMFDQWMTQNNVEISDDSIEKMTTMRDQAKSLADRAEAELMASFS